MKRTEFKRYVQYNKWVLLMVFLVILAGGIVRMSQSGMGCPDWPTCFGMWIPPINEDQLPQILEKYLSKQDIDHSFNVYHTWIEYINRLLGAILGLFILYHTYLSWKLFRKDRRVNLLWSVLLLFLVGFQGWLGKLVVDHNLNEFKITLHMVTALIIAIIPLIIITGFEGKTLVNKRTWWLVVCTTGIILIQIVLGTQVREEVDMVSKSFQYKSRDLWLDKLGYIFYIHRSFSWVILVASYFVMYQLRKIPGLNRWGNLQFFLTLGILGLGIIMNYAGIPAWTQPLHLLSASVIFCLMFYILLKVKK